MIPRWSSTVTRRIAAFQTSILPPTFLPSPSLSRSSSHSCHRVRFVCSTASIHISVSGNVSDDRDERWMRYALREARLARERNEVPVGAVIVRDDTFISSSGNSVESCRDPTCHAEINAIRAACERIQAWRLIDTTLYCTLEPCAMCLSGASLARISRIVYGARDLRLGACGTWVNLPELKHPYHSFDEVVGGVLQDECSQLLKDFFRQRRIEAKRGG